MAKKEPLFFKIFTQFIQYGEMKITFQNAKQYPHTLTATGAMTGKSVAICLQNLSDLRKITLNPELAIPEAFMDGRLTLHETTLDDFIIFLFHNRKIFAKTPVGRLMGLVKRWKARLSTAIKRKAAKQNVAHHYDLTDALYACFLDNRRQYSCAYYESETDSLELAQHQKIARIGAKLRLKAGAQVLDIGCGWGELAYGLSALEKNIHVHGITLSDNQIDYAINEVAKRDKTPNLSFSLQDYRDETGHYDNIVSVGMLEHVGRKAYDRYFSVVDHCLNEDGTALIHTIGKRRAELSTNRFIDKYIFPGGYLPTLSDLATSLAKYDLHIADVECLHTHYAQTLKHWRERCEANKDKLISLYDERFYRMWLFYLISCEHFFRLDEGVVYQIQLIKKRSVKPSTRDYIKAKEQIYLKKLWQQKPPSGNMSP
ncbi:MAG: class I SAM-dependent methyltransferase [Candidatus Puniceispirillaceae bacterium]